MYIYILLNKTHGLPNRQVFWREIFGAKFRERGCKRSEFVSTKLFCKGNKTPIRIFGTLANASGESKNKRKSFVPFSSGDKNIMSIWTTPQRMRGISESASPKVAESFQSLYIRCISVSSNHWIVKIHLRERGADPKHPSLKHIFWPIAKKEYQSHCPNTRRLQVFFGTFWLEKKY